MRVIGRLLEATLAMTFLVGLMAAFFNRSRRARHRRPRLMSPGSHPGWDTFSSGYDGTVLPPVTASAVRKRVHRSNRKRADEPRRHEARRLARLGRVRPRR